MDVLDGLEVVVTLDRGYLRGWHTTSSIKLLKSEKLLWQVRERVSGTEVLWRVISCSKEETVNDTLRALYDWTVEWPLRT